jgi:phage N-6-adenine-methyltransferase
LILFYDGCREYDIHPVLDVAASHINHVCKRYFTKADDALTKEWNVDFFGNFPYSKVAKFIKYAYEQYKKHNVNGLILTYSKTDTKWWHKYIEGKAEIHFIKGRVKFFDENGKIKKYCQNCKVSFSGIDICPRCDNELRENCAPYPSCWIIYRKKLLK